ncbi:helix-turn-helix domain-containing protein [Actinokineospora enzanensis]|uniref:helix-turn-helix domain-containing protein n=1 Tax=Actinokineospora enzanensis TaxID=155975 RepID=UPI00037A4A61|nr:helix-turn-helix transcriptional regulator [Actinokineospora enzanensis]
MGQARPTFERRQLGLVLRRLRERAGKTQQAAAEAVGKVRSRIVQLEDGTATASETDLKKILDCYGVTGEEHATVTDLGAQARKRQQRRVYVDQLPDAYRRFADLEASASEINHFETGIIPGLLQSQSYIQALFAEADGIWWQTDDPQSEDRLYFRMERQSRVLESGHRRILRFVITEDALRANMGSPEVMREQLNHLLDLLDKHPDLNIRILRGDTYGNPARGANLMIFAFAERGTPVAYSFSALGLSTYYDGEREIERMLLSFYRVWELSLSRKESRRLIVEIAKE